MTPDEADARKRHDEAMARFDERLGAMRETLELHIGLEAEAQKRQDAAIALHEQRISKTAEEHEKTERALRRAIRLGVQWARADRRKRQELAKLQQDLAKRQQDLAEYADHRHRELEALVNKFLERGGNGQH
jgi:hypothetical protein